MGKKEWTTCGAREFLGGRDAPLYDRVASLIDTRVQVHTNRTKKIWSIHSVSRPGACLAYVKDSVFLRDVRWVPPTVGAARGTYFPARSKSDVEQQDTGKRTVQAFAEGILLYAENDKGNPEKNYCVDGWEAELTDAMEKCEKIEATYRPFVAEDVGFFRNEHNQALQYSSYAVLDWIVEDKKRKGKAYAYCDPRFFTAEYTDQFMEEILCPSEEWLKDRFRSEKDFQDYLDTERGQVWLSCTRTRPSS